MATRATTVVVDTNVFSADLVRSTRSLVDLYRPILTGRRYLISFQTVAEIEYGVRRRNWGPSRLARVEEHIARAEIVWPGPALLSACVDLRVACEHVGHPLAQPAHESDRWIAATALTSASLSSRTTASSAASPALAFETAPS